MSEGYPPTLIYTWQSKSTAPEEINALIQRCFTLSSFHPQPWSIEIILKNPPKKEKKLVSLSSTVSKNGSVTATSGSSADEAIYFVRQPDMEVCCVVPKRKTMSTEGIEVITLTDNCEERWLTKTFPVVGKQGSSGTTDWVTRSIWRASGQRFIFSNEYVISIGYLEHMGASTQPCIEVSLLFESNNGTGTANSAASLNNLQLCTTKMHRIVTDLLSILALDSEILPSIDGKTSNNSNNTTIGGLEMSIAGRSLQWIHCL